MTVWRNPGSRYWETSGKHDADTGPMGTQYFPPDD